MPSDGLLRISRTTIVPAFPAPTDQHALWQTDGLAVSVRATPGILHVQPHAKTRHAGNNQRQRPKNEWNRTRQRHVRHKPGRDQPDACADRHAQSDGAAQQEEFFDRGINPVPRINPGKVKTPAE